MKKNYQHPRTFNVCIESGYLLVDLRAASNGGTADPESAMSPKRLDVLYRI